MSCRFDDETGFCLACGAMVTAEGGCRRLEPRVLPFEPALARRHHRALAPLIRALVAEARRTAPTCGAAAVVWDAYGHDP